MSDVKVGDLVRLKSGGPEMTVAGVFKVNAGPSEPSAVVSCTYFTATTFERLSVPAECLVVTGRSKPEPLPEL